MFRKSAVLLLSLLVAAVAAGCVPVAPAPAPVQATKTPKPTFTPTVDWTPTSVAFATSAPEATQAPAQVTPAVTTGAQPEATVEPTAEPTAEPTTAAPEETRLTAAQNVNVRTGPGTTYPAIGRLTAGQSFEITGRSDAGDWVKFDFNGRDGWVTFALVSIAGDLNAVQVAQAPALPTARPQPTAAPRPVQPAQPTAVPQPTNPPAPPAPQYPFRYVDGSANCQPNAGTTYFNGFVRYVNNSPRNGVCVHIAFFGPRQTKCSGCGGVGDGVWGFAPFGNDPPPAGTTVEIYVTSCDGMPPEGDLSTFSGPPEPRSTKFVKTLSEGEQCTGITFVGD